jgi:hypothetical protein
VLLKAGFDAYEFRAESKCTLPVRERTKTNTGVLPHSTSLRVRMTASNGKEGDSLQEEEDDSLKGEEDFWLQKKGKMIDFKRTN